MNRIIPWAISICGTVFGGSRRRRVVSTSAVFAVPDGQKRCCSYRPYLPRSSHRSTGFNCMVGFVVMSVVVLLPPFVPLVFGSVRERPRWFVKSIALR